MPCMLACLRSDKEQAVVAHVFIPSTGETETGRSLELTGKPQVKEGYCHKIKRSGDSKE